MTNASRDANRVTAILGVSSIDLETSTPIAVNAVTGAVLIDGTSLYANLDTRYLMLDCSNDPLTGTLDGASLDFTGHMALGTDASLSATTILNINETLTTVDTTHYGIFAQLNLEPAGVLGAITTLVAMDMQAQYNSTVDASVYGYIHGIKGEAVNLSEMVGAGDINELVGVYGKASNLGISDVTSAIAGLFTATNDDGFGNQTGSIASAYSLIARAYTDKDTGIITDRYGLYIEDITGGGGTTNQYGIYCEALVGGTTTNLFIKNVSADSDFGSGDIDTTGTITGTTIAGANVTSGADPGHTHTGASLSGIDISADTNLAVSSPIVLTDDTLSLDQSAVDHGSIGGLTDDDHAQYWIRTVARADSYLTTGHLAVGSNAEATANRIAWFRENSTAVDTSRYGVHADYYWLPSGALGSTSAHYGVLVDSVWDTDVDGSTHGNLYGTRSRAFIHFTSTGALLNATGIIGIGDNRGAGTVTTLIGVQGEVRNDDNDSGEETGDVTSAYSFLASGYTDKGTGVIGARYGLYIEDVTGGGLLTNQYGIYCPALTGASGDNLFIKNISADSDFGSGDIDTTGTITGTTIAGANTNWDAAYDHSIDNTQAHTDYLLNNASDTTSGTLTATGGFISGGNIVSDTDSTDDLGSSGAYWANAYADKVYFNSTAALDGTTAAGDVNLTGNLRIPETTSTTGQIKIGATRYLHFYGTNNVFLGNTAGNVTLTDASENVGVGTLCLDSLTTGDGNVGLGYAALHLNEEGVNNMGIGKAALQNSIASDCVAIGSGTLFSNTSGANNVGIGTECGYFNATGSNNTFVGMNAGKNTGAANKSGSVNIGFQAGYYETASNKLFIDNQPRDDEADARVKALIYGVFDAAVANQFVTINGALNVVGLTTVYDKIQFTQTDGNEYIDSLADGYLDIGATTGIRLNSPLTRVTGDFYIGNDTHLDPALVMTGDHNDGQLTWKEDEDYFQFENTVNIAGNLTLTGTVDGIDIATDVAANTTHRGLTTTAHGGILDIDGVAKITVGTAEPESPTAGDLWVDTN